MSFDELPPTWEFSELGESGVAVLDCEHKTPPDAGDGYPYIAIPNLVRGKINLERIRKITHAHLTEWTRRTTPQGGDIIVTRRARVGDTAVIPAGLLCAIGQNLVILRSDRSRIDQRFLRWAARGPVWMREVDRLRNVGAVFDSLNVRDIARLRIPIPPLPEQRRIAAVLDVVDAKLDCNEQQREICDGLVALVFQHRVLAAERENGWAEGNLTTIASFVNGRAFTNRATGTGRPVLRIRELNSGIGETTVYNDVHVESQHIAGHHDLLFSWSGSLGVYRWHGPEALINQHIFKVLPHSPFPLWFVEGWVRAHLSAFQRVAKDKATTMGHIKREDLSRAKVMLPPVAALGELNELLSPIDARAGALAAESNVLKRLLIELQPKLISGVIRIPPAADEEDPGHLVAA